MNQVFHITSLLPQKLFATKIIYFVLFLQSLFV